MEKSELLSRFLKEFYEEAMKTPKIMKEIGDSGQLHDVSEKIKLLLQLD